MASTGLAASTSSLCLTRHGRTAVLILGLLSVVGLCSTPAHAAALTFLQVTNPPPSGSGTGEASDTSNGGVYIGLGADPTSAYINNGSGLLSDGSLTLAPGSNTFHFAIFDWFGSTGAFYLNLFFTLANPSSGANTADISGIVNADIAGFTAPSTDVFDYSHNATSLSAIIGDTTVTMTALSLITSPYGVITYPGATQAGNPTLVGTFTLNATSVPEPASMALIATGFVLTGALRRRRANRAIPPNPAHLGCY